MLPPPHCQCCRLALQSPFSRSVKNHLPDSYFQAILSVLHSQLAAETQHADGLDGLMQLLADMPLVRRALRNHAPDAVPASPVATAPPPNGDERGGRPAADGGAGAQDMAEAVVGDLRTAGSEFLLEVGDAAHTSPAAAAVPQPPAPGSPLAPGRGAPVWVRNTPTADDVVVDLPTRRHSHADSPAAEPGHGRVSAASGGWGAVRRALAGVGNAVASTGVQGTAAAMAAAEASASAAAPHSLQRLPSGNAPQMAPVAGSRWQTSAARVMQRHASVGAAPSLPREGQRTMRRQGSAAAAPAIEPPRAELLTAEAGPQQRELSKHPAG